MAFGGSGQEVFTRISSQTWTVSRVHSWSNTFPTNINDFSDYVICNIAFNADYTTFYSKCDQTSDLWQQLELASEYESDLRDTVDWGMKWTADLDSH